MLTENFQTVQESRLESLPLFAFEIKLFICPLNLIESLEKVIVFGHINPT